MNRSARRRVLAALWAACCLVACKQGAGETPAPPSARSETPAPEVDPAAAKLRLQKLRDDTVIERAKLVSAASNHASNASSLRKYEREAAEVRLWSRVPLTQDLPGLRASLEAALSAAGLRGEGFSLVPRAGPRRRLPERLPEGPRFEPLREDIRGIIDVRFRVPGAKPAQLPALLKSLGGMLRLFYVAKVKPSDAGLAVEGEAYWFHADFEVPRTQLRARDLKAELRRAGLDPNPLARDPEAQKLLDEVAADYREMERRLPDYEKSIEQARALIRFDARMRFVHDRAGEAGDRTAAEVQR